MNFRKNLRNISMAAVFACCLSSCGEQPGYKYADVSNDGGSACYEIFVGSFCDSNGDGVGDLNGIRSKLGYLQDMGVSYLWLTPIHPSPSYHHYDVMDYYAVSEKFGTLEDFENLCKEAKAKGIGILLDMVFNHCSRKSTWYKNWLAHMDDEDSPYYDNFCWDYFEKDGYFFESSLNCYIEGHFSDQMPELNWDNPRVRETFADIQDFWLDKGAAGFRYDAVKYYYCTQSGDTITGNTEKNVAALTYLKERARAKKPDCYLIGECWVNSNQELYSYTDSGMNMFHFGTSGISSNLSAGVLPGNNFLNYPMAVVNAQKALKASNPNGDLAIFISNHDQDRWGNFRNGRANAEEARKLLVSNYLLTPGTPYIYYGEEIEMLGERKSTDKTDAMRRQAMIWGEAEITCAQPDKYTYTPQTELTVKSSLEDGYSLLRHYKKVLNLRNSYKDVFRKGDYEVKQFDGKRAYAFEITYNGEVYYLVHNCHTATVELDIEGTLLADIPTMKEDATLNNGKLKLAGYSSAFIRR